jgi:AmmeMemoRadiSam system protein A
VLSPADREVALDIASRAATAPLGDGRRWLPDVAALPAALAAPGASFVTLRAYGDLLGCIGSLAPRRPLGVDIAHNAAAAAFDDPRLPALSRADVPVADIHVSVLGPLDAMPVVSMAELVRELRPGVDGVLVETATRRGTFLPSVWEQLPDAADFVTALWRKAGLVPGRWPDGLRVHRYQVQEFGRPLRD